ncbi:hypothetical protein LCGC14_0475500 [marine sediment metagenome]|uniref:Uncharacterized protein n=1 Tax=marine sediment metagenome TaxID=412755 RepID=A0A0F9STW0_9ZZZZ
MKALLKKLQDEQARAQTRYDKAVTTREATSKVAEEANGSLERITYAVSCLESYISGGK